MFSDFQDLITAKTQKMLNSEWVVRVHAMYVQIWPLVSFLYCLSLSLSAACIQTPGSKRNSQHWATTLGGKEVQFYRNLCKIALPLI